MKYTAKQIVNHKDITSVLRRRGIDGTLTLENFNEISKEDLAFIERELGYYDSAVSFEIIVEFVKTKTELTPVGRTFEGHTKKGQKFSIYTDLQGYGMFVIDGVGVSRLDLIEQEF
jgi:hypothetical protein